MKVNKGGGRKRGEYLVASRRMVDLSIDAVSDVKGLMWLMK